MFKSYWITAVTLGLILFAALGQAQEKTQGEQGQIQAEQKPAQTLPVPLLVDIIEDEPAANSRKRREAETRQHEIDDLAAQQGMNIATQAMNEATQRMALYAMWSTVFVVIGTALLFVTLWLTRQANRAAQSAVDVTRDIGERQLRPYVLLGQISEIRPGGDKFVPRNNTPYVCCSVGNYGRTPAIIHYVLDSFGPTPDNHTCDPDSGVRKQRKDFNSAIVLSPGKVIPRHYPAIFPAVVKCIEVNGNVVPRIEGHEHVFLVINIKFEDVTGMIRINRFTWKYDGSYGDFLRYGGKAYNYEIEVSE